MKNTSLKILLTAVCLVTLLAGCTAAGGTKASSTTQPVEVKRGNLDITVTTDGNLSMPNAYNLSFGTQGQVTSVLVNEGDYVRQGALLATQDPSSQIDAIKTALFSIQTAQNNLTLRNAQGCYLPWSYPDLSLSRMSDEAQNDINTAVGYFNQGKYMPECVACRYCS